MTREELYNRTIENVNQLKKDYITRLNWLIEKTSDMGFFSLTDKFDEKFEPFNDSKNTWVRDDIKSYYVDMGLTVQFEYNHYLKTYEITISWEG